MDGPTWNEQRKFCMQHLRKMGFGGDLMERIIIEEVNDIMLDISRKCEVCVYIYIFTNKIKNNIITVLDFILEW